MAAREHLLKIGVSGVRGVVGGFLTPMLAAKFAQAFGTYTGHGRVVLGRDTRASGPMLEHAVTCGLMSVGCEVVKLGVMPTPVIQTWIAETKAAGGIALTASHNPAEYNALKLFNHEGLFFNQYEREELLHLYHQSEFSRAAFDDVALAWEEGEKPVDAHIARILALIDHEAIRRRRFRVALDGVNGAGSLMSIRFLREVLGCELHAIHVNPALPFPRVAEPGPETLGELAALVQREHCDIGFGQDPDGDRLAVADERGVVMDNDDVLALAMDAALHRAGGDVVVNLTTSSVVDAVAAKHGRRVFRSPVGEANVVERMKVVHAGVGGEGSNGGLIFPSVHYCRDSYTAMALLLDQMARTGSSIHQLQEVLPQFTRRGGKVRFRHGTLGPLMQKLEARFAEAAMDHSDGLKLNIGDSWIHVRASNTEPLLRVAVESPSTERADELFAEVSAMLAT
jgi:phosphomannomutase